MWLQLPVSSPVYVDDPDDTDKIVLKQKMSCRMRSIWSLIFH